MGVGFSAAAEPVGPGGRQGGRAQIVQKPEGALDAKMPPGWKGRITELESAVLWGVWLEAIEYARSEIACYASWREQDAPVLADGYDAESVVQAAFERLLTRQSRDVPILYSLEDINRELRSLIKHRVRWLHERSERKLVRYEWEVLPPTEDGELVSVLEPLPWRGANPDDELMQKEKERLLEEFKGEFESTLSKDRNLREVFRAVWDGQKRRHIAQRIGVGVRAVKALQARMSRKLYKFGVRTRGAMAEMLRGIIEST